MQATITGIEAVTNTDTSKLLTKILNTFYTSGIDRIKTYGKTPSGNIVGEFVADGTSFQYVLNMKTNTVSYEPVGNRTASKADSLLAEQENTDRFKAIYSVREAFEVSDAIAIEQKLDSWFFRADAATKAKVGVKAKANKSGKTLTCTPGKTFPCGAVCRAVGKPCKQPMSPEVQEIAAQVAAKIKTPTTATATPATTFTTTTASPTDATSGKISAQKLAELITATKTPESDPGKKGENRLMPLFVNSKRVNGLTQEFDEKDLREAAEAFIKLGGFVEPPVLKRRGEGADISYDLVSGEFQVATAIVAKAMQPKKWDTFPATVIEGDNEEAIQKQIKTQKSATTSKSRSVTNISTAKPKKIANETPAEFERRRSNENTGKMMHLQIKKIDPGEPHSESETAVTEAAKLIKVAGRNWIPVPVQQTKDYEYEVVGNSFIYEAAKKAGIERLWTVVVDPLPENIKQAKFLAR